MTKTPQQIRNEKKRKRYWTVTLEDVKRFNRYEKEIIKENPKVFKNMSIERRRLIVFGYRKGFNRGRMGYEN